MKTSSLGFLAATFAALLPFFTLGYLLYGDVNSKYFLVVLFTDILVLTGAWALYKDKVSISLKGRYFLGALTIVLCTQYVSAILGVFPERSFWSDIFWSSGVLFLTHLAITMVLLGELLKEQDWSLVRKAIAVSSALFGFLTILGVQGFGATGKFLWVPLGELSLTIGNETYAGAYLLIAFFITLIERSRVKDGTEKIVLTVSAFLIGLSPLLTNIGIFFGRTPIADIFEHPALLLGSARSSSAALLALMVCVIGYLVIRRFVAEKFRVVSNIFLCIGVFVVIAIGVGLLFVSGSPVQQAYIETSSAARPIVWEASYKAFLAKPMFGWGPENFNHAFEAHFDNRLFQEENLAEIWFERAHNVFLDTLVSVGVAGTLSFLLLIIAYLYVIYRAKKRKQISDVEAALLTALVPAHLLQMQTGFDTVVTYTLLALVGGYVMFLERSSGGERASVPGNKIAALLLCLLALTSFKFCFFDEYGRQSALINTLTSRSAAEQKTAIETSLARVSSFESLRMSSGSFIQGSLALLAEAPTPQKTKLILEFTSIYEEHYKRYLAVQPDHYRARMNYAYLLLIQTTLGNNRISDAQQLIRDSYRLSPGNPITYILDSLSELYGGDLKEADRLMQEALAINPNIEFTQEAAAYLQKQKQQFPNISVLKITNL